MKVLILSLSTGQGHHQCAMAIKDRLKSLNAECQMLDALEYINPLLSESVSQGYLISTQYSPTAYGKFYRLAEKKNKPSRKLSFSRLAINVMSKKLEKHINNFAPDVIICTHVYASQMISEFDTKSAKTIGIITDFTVHPYWEDTNLDYYVLASDLLTHQANKKYISNEKLKSFGIPIQEKFANKVDKQTARQRLNIEDKLTIFIMSGSMGYGNVIKHIKRLDRLNMDFQIVVVCGRNARMKKSIDKIVLNKKIYNFGYVDNVDLIMDAADIMISKPGGLSVSEGLAKGLPMILMNPIPGQEERNAEFLLNNGVAMMMSSTMPVDECLYQMLKSSWRFKNFQNIVSFLGKPNAAKDLGDFIIEITNS